MDQPEDSGDIGTPIDGLMDALIDDVARDMTGVPPDAGLARRVAVRIAQVDNIAARRTRHGWSRGWLLAPAAAACVLALAVFAARETREPVSVRLAPDATTRPTATPTVTTPQATTSPTTAGRSAPVAAPGRPAAAAPPTTAGFETLTLAPIDVEQIEIAPLARNERIDISPIAIERIEISAMP